MLLESLYGAFDKIAFKYGIFKVETCGDSYVAICGLPEPRKRHATAVARFARDTMVKFHEIIQRLQITLGPETSELKMRVGIHSGMFCPVFELASLEDKKLDATGLITSISFSGQVTAGVLRGERGKYSYFIFIPNSMEILIHFSARPIEQLDFNCLGIRLTQVIY